ncbi:Type I restriction-modification system specificity subunit S [Lactiplantibacillus plantarum]|uniref:restriction endonuclease subunit S n=1 Tax=Lactiplantibacillus plantarum TaxID=1590 RepID=UPI0007B55BF7|nr:restriction endonuclease subunit S [Lactiplantibacillus plantarum]KZU34309.1 Type I restriction-modification system specificity subunit S [Lactiplantibacillus plantarum]
MKVRTLIPNIRFRGFSDPWEQRKFFDNIKQVLDYRGKTPKKLNMKWNEEPKGYLALSAINVKAGYIDKHIETYYASEKLYKKWMGKDSLSAGDILFTTEAPMGNVALVPDKGKYILSQRTIAFKLDKAKLDNLFWLEFLESTIFKSKAVAISSGGTAQGVSQKSLRQVIVIIPSDVNEQKRIGQVLVTVDNLIAANEDKVQQLKTLKKLMMQKIFSQEWRFKGFTDPWEQRKLESVVIVYDKGRVPVTSTERISGDTPYYGANGIQDYVDGYTHDGEFTLIAEDGANDTRNYPIKFVSGKIWVNNHAHVLAGKQNILNTRFLSFSLQQINIEPFLSGSGRAKLNASEMKKLLIAVPNIYEQIKVENFLGEMAHLIAANEDKLNQLKRLKKYLMQNLFV